MVIVCWRRRHTMPDRDVCANGVVKVQGSRSICGWKNIPYKETRNYVQNVMVFNAIYQERLNQPVDFFSDQSERLRY